MSASLTLQNPWPEVAVAPLDRLTLAASRAGTVVVADARGHEYHRAAAGPETAVSFAVGGALGRHTATLLDEAGQAVATTAFAVDARTDVVDDQRQFKELFDMLNKTMRCYSPRGYGEMAWRGKTYAYFVHWILDHTHTAKGMQYFSPHTGGLVELMAAAQKPDGMIWSNANKDPGPGYFDSAYGPYGFAERVDGGLFVRQPVENHNEYNYVDAMHRHWKSSGDDAWMKRYLDSGIKALEYSVTSPYRWSEKFQLLKRGYTIDSWDFQVEDEYTVHFPLATSQQIDAEKTKFGVFFGDNQGYAHACEQLAEMLGAAGRTDDATTYRQRAAQIHQRLNELTWNGKFFTHRVEEDPAVKRDLGVDEARQIAMSNCYALNRDITHEQAIAILETYLDLKNQMAAHRGPGEWYAIYPPFGRGFGKDSGKWQYMNAGVHGHAAGELVQGAFRHGCEAYGVDQLLRLLDLGRRSDGMVRFAWTGGWDAPPPAQAFDSIDISTSANMDVRDAGAAGVAGWMGGEKDNDMRNLPVGRQTFAGVPYAVPDPAANGRRAAIGVGHKKANLPESVTVAVGKKAGAVYLLHTAGGMGPSGQAATVTFTYEDGSEKTTVLLNNRHLVGWWFPKTAYHPRFADSGVAWEGPNPRSNAVGVCWTALPNPEPDKTVQNLSFTAAPDGAIYALLGITLANRMPYKEADLVSTGGPDNWAGGTTMLGLIEGLCGVADAPGTTAMAQLILSPRWAASETKHVRVTTRYAASDGYVAYRYHHDPAARTLTVELTGKSARATLRVLLPTGVTAAKRVTIGGKPADVRHEKVETSTYAVTTIDARTPTEVVVAY